ncbi:R3H domain-containing protein 4-like isoform X1 [Centruroides vittatus]|uniref:R3H domain-containing protein 4-like isoform X1 n=1 Tax=Centruroides vittatus TaxID=120091 RepID=UPI00350F02AD
MGVIRDLNNITNPFDTSIEDVLEQILDDVEEEQEVIRRSRKIRQRPPVLPQSTGSSKVLRHKSGKKYRRAENASFLMSLAEGDETKEVSIYDFVPETVSAFTQLLMEQESMEAWNNFINHTDEEQWQILKDIDQGEKVDLQTSLNKNASEVKDCRTAHPAFSAEECFLRIDSVLRATLKRKHVPLGTLAQLEDEISKFFQNKPLAVYKSQLQSSYERLMLHALCQYMNLYSKSYNEGAVRWTKVQNSHCYFHPPAVMLSTYLERKISRHVSHGV